MADRQHRLARTCCSWNRWDVICICLHRKKNPSCKSWGVEHNGFSLQNCNYLVSCARHILFHLIGAHLPCFSIWPVSGSYRRTCFSSSPTLKPPIGGLRSRSRPLRHGRPCAIQLMQRLKQHYLLQPGSGRAWAEGLTLTIFIWTSREAFRASLCSQGRAEMRWDETRQSACRDAE